MAAQNDFLVWAGGLNANVLSQQAYATLPYQTSGVVGGVASSQQANKVWRQASIIASMIGKFIGDQTNLAVVDDGTVQTIETNFIQAIKNTFVIPPTGVAPGTYGPTSTITVEADGRLTAISNSGLPNSGVAPGTYPGATVTVGSNGIITGISSVAYGPLSASNTWTGSNVFNGTTYLNHGVKVSGGILGGGQVRLAAGAYSLILLNDGANAYLLTTNPNDIDGVWNGFRPISFNLASGVVTLDATGVGVVVGGGLTADKGITANNDITSGAGALRAAVGAFGSADTSRAVLLGDFTMLAGNPGYCRLPNGMILVVGSANCGNLAPGDYNTIFVNFPIAFPNGVWAGFVTDYSGGGAQGVYAFGTVSNSQCVIQGRNLGPLSSSPLVGQFWAIGN